MLLILDAQIERDVCFGRCIGKADSHRSRSIEFARAQSVLVLIAHIGMHAANHLLHEFLGAELQDFVGHIDLVDVVVIAVKPGRIGLVGGVLDDDRSLTEIGERSACILEPSQSTEDQHAGEKPLPACQEIEEEVLQVDVLAVLFLFVCHRDRMSSLLLLEYPQHGSHHAGQ